ncbi:heterogeneous nuclear ribonucleoprotein A2 homolog 1-like [Onthophagus taurus]|uniref:heterogeneous nuclear ribonucleoprotein A2 homolog 1-like n=1 Tax=Onthophagus taurus TaxID=166361 RepID=UPI0039BDC551
MRNRKIKIAAIVLIFAYFTSGASRRNKSSRRGGNDTRIGDLDIYNASQTGNIRINNTGQLDIDLDDDGGMSISGRPSRGGRFKGGGGRYKGGGSRFKGGGGGRFKGGGGRYRPGKKTGNRPGWVKRPGAGHRQRPGGKFDGYEDNEEYSMNEEESYNENNNENNEIDYDYNNVEGNGGGNDVKTNYYGMDVMQE